MDWDEEVHNQPPFLPGSSQSIREMIRYSSEEALRGVGNLCFFLFFIPEGRNNLAVHKTGSIQEASVRCSVTLLLPGTPGMLV